jgi:preprotein translocase subunit SecD
VRRIRIRRLVLLGLVVAVCVTSLSYQQFDISFAGIHLKRGSDAIMGLQLGLDLRGGSHLVYKADISDPTSDQMEGVIRIIDRRINAYGVSEPVIQKMGDNRILVQLPGVKDVEEAKRLIGRTATLQFKERECTGNPCADPENHQDKDIGLTGEDLTRAYVGQHPTTTLPVINLEFNGRGAKIFGELTTRISETYNSSTPDRIATFLDDEELIAPVAARPILGGNAFIEGQDFTMERVRNIVIQLESGRLPIPISVIQEQNVDATLGAESLKKSLVAGLVGLVVVLLFMISYYRVLGVVAAVALVIYTVLVLAIFKMIPVTLTLAGIAAFILSIGMAVDANILIFERMKEELRAGRTVLSAMEVGFNRAWPSIRDSNVSTFITCAILFWFGNKLGASMVTGFALTLFIGVAVSMFTAITVSRTILNLSGLTPLRRKRSFFYPGFLHFKSQEPGKDKG